MNIWTKYGLNESADGTGNGMLSVMQEVKARADRGEYKAPVKINISTWDADTRDAILAGAALDPFESTLGFCHSYGGAGTIREAKQLGDDVLFDELIGIECVTRLFWGQFKFNSWNLSNNIEKATFYYQRNSTVPILSSLIRNLGDGNYKNVDLSAERINGRPVDHCKICQSQTIRTAVLDAVNFWTDHEAEMRVAA